MKILVVGWSKSYNKTCTSIKFSKKVLRQNKILFLSIRTIATIPPPSSGLNLSFFGKKMFPDERDEEVRSPGNYEMISVTFSGGNFCKVFLRLYSPFALPIRESKTFCKNFSWGGIFYVNLLVIPKVKDPTALFFFGCNNSGGWNTGGSYIGISKSWEGWLPVYWRTAKVAP